MAHSEVTPLTTSKITDDFRGTVKDVVVALTAAGVRAGRIVTRPRKAVLVCPHFPSDRNVGDRALTLGGIEGLRARTRLPIELVETSGETIPDFGIERVSIRYGLHRTFLDGGDLAARVTWLKYLADAESVHLIGADCVDESYSRAQSVAKLRAIADAGRAGVPSSIISFSVAEVTDLFATRARRFPARSWFYARDPVTAERLAAKSVGRVARSADLSFLVQAAEEVSAPGFEEFVATSGRPAVGFNCNNQLFDGDEDPEAKSDFVAKVLTKFADDAGVGLVLLPNSRMQYEKFWQTLRHRLEAAGTTVFLVEPIPSPDVYKATISRLEHVFSVSLHISLFALSVGVPVTCFPYLGKFEGVLREFGIPGNQIALDEFRGDPGDFAARLCTHYDARGEAAETISSRVAAIRDAAAAPFIRGTVAAR